jgi:subtilisin family serine protease
MFRQRAAALLLSSIALFTVFTLFGSAQTPPGQSRTPKVQGHVRDRAARGDTVRVIVELNLRSGSHVAEGRLLSGAAVSAQRQAISESRSRLLAKLASTRHHVVHSYQSLPYVAVEVDAGALAVLESAGDDVLTVMEDRLVRADLAESVPLIQGDQAWAAGYDGTGTVVAIVDSGVDRNHPFLGGRVVEEACYSSSIPGESESVCPNGQPQQIGVGAAAPCSLPSCMHGTHVAGIAAGNGSTAGQAFSGVAKNAQIMAVQVFSQIIDNDFCGGAPPCMGGYTSDVIAGLERVYAVALAGRNIVSVNMSLGEGAFSDYCDSEPYKPMIDNLRAIGIASVVASGNSYSATSMGSPACVSSAVSVGSTTKSDAVSWFSNVTPFLSLFAPGDTITSSVPGGGFDVASGTSMAAPHVTGAWALLRQAAPNASVGTVLNALRTTGLPITDNRFWAPGTSTAPRIRVFQALGALTPVTSPEPAIASVAPLRVRAGATATVTVTGSGFNGFSVVQWNGAAQPTVALSNTQVRATIAAADLVVGTSMVSVFNPAPGGGTSNSLPVAVDPAASLTVNATTLGPGSAATVTLANGYGGARDWIALAATGAADRTYLSWTYVGAGVTSRNWTTTLPNTAGTYEFRLFLNDGYTRAATSPAITVDPSLRPAPLVSSMSPASANAGGPAFTLTVTGSSFMSASIVRWRGEARPTTFVSATSLQAAISAADIAAAGTAQVTVFTPAPGGGTSTPLTFTINTPPTLAISASSVPQGGSETVTLTGGLGGSTDWLALASTSAPNTSYVQYIYVGAGVTTRTWTVNMPTTAGTYEFRLFLNNGYTRAATSPPVTVVAPPSPVPVLTSLSPTSVSTGDTSFTVTAVGSGFASTSVVRWNGADRPTTFVSSTQLRATLPASDRAAVGTAQVTVFTPAPGGGLSSALPFAITQSPALSVSATSVAAGGSVTVTLVNGAGGTKDWLALASTSAVNSVYIQWVYVGAGVTTRTWTVNMPTSPGTYEFRYFLNGGYTRAATSPSITVTP